MSVEKLADDTTSNHQNEHRDAKNHENRFFGCLALLVQGKEKKGDYGKESDKRNKKGKGKEYFPYQLGPGNIVIAISFLSNKHTCLVRP